MSWLSTLGGEWSPLYRIVSHVGEPWWKACGNEPGVYRLIGLNNSGDLLPQAIDRVCGKDPSGTIYIGAGIRLGGRVSKLIMQHDAGYKTKAHKKFPEILGKFFTPDRLAFSWMYTKKSEDVYVKEWDLIGAYKEVFGEAPPLNGQG